MKAICYAISTGIILSICCLYAAGQSTQITYQGSLKDGANPANGNHDFEFLLYDALAGGGQLGTTITLGSVAVTEGTFSVKLDFGSQFPGANRFLEIRVRQSGGGAFTPLTPRHQIGSTPYSIKSLTADTAATASNATNAATAANALQLGGVAANQFVVTGDSRLSDARPPTSGSANYIQNQNTVQQTANFAINGKASSVVVEAISEYRLGGNSVLSMIPDAGLVVGWAAGLSNTTGVQNTFVGSYAGGVNTTGSYNSFFGRSSGQANTTGSDNSFFGQLSGWRTTTGNSNSYVGSNSGQDNTTGSENSFFGQSSGLRNTTGSFNSFYGRNSGRGNTTGNHNSFLGIDAGRSNTNSSSGTFLGSNAGFSNTTGVNNTFVGAFSGLGNTEGANNSFVGAFSGDGNTTGFNNVTLGVAADFGLPNLSNAAAIGTSALVNCSNCMVLGGINGINNATADTNVGIGTTSPSNRLHIVANGGNLVLGNPGCNPGIAAIGFVATLSGCNNYALLGDGGVTVINRPTGAVIEFREGNATQARFAAGGVFSLNSLGAAGATALCRNASNQISTCSSSARYKSNIAQFNGGLELLKRLRPVSFNWKDGGMLDLGLVAEDVVKVEPLLTTTNDNGEVEGVKYDRVGVVLINAVKEQQAQIEALKERLDAQARALTELRKELAKRSAHKAKNPK